MNYPPLYTYARQILREWPKPSVHAMPYIEAMSQCVSIDDLFYADSASSIVAYFLANAAGWRGETARRVKAELKQMLKEYHA